MQNSTGISWSDRLWGPTARISYLFICAFLLLFLMLGSRDLWTQEHRWADIVSAMFFNHDFLHPRLNEVDYYDKPLLSYWFIAAIASITGKLTPWAMRLPSACAGLLAIWSIYRIGFKLESKRLGMIAAWLLLTTFYFVFWARTSSADMLNMAGTLFAVCWYFEKKATPSFLNYTIFFLILALTSLCKGLVGAVIPVLVILPDLLSNQEWKKHLRFSFFVALIPALIVYLAPFVASEYVAGNSYGQNGLYLVYRENILRYFQPFDHVGPIYTYLIYLPVYLLPWTFFFIPALYFIVRSWKSMSASSRWMAWAVLLTFLFFTISGSRRSYYVLPIVPFAILMTAHWIAAAGRNSKCDLWAGRVACGFFVALFVNFIIVQPIYYSQGGSGSFAAKLQQEATKIRPWSEWKFVMLDARSKERSYLHLPPSVKDYRIMGSDRSHQTEASLLKAWPFLTAKKSDTIFISRAAYRTQLHNLLPDYQIIDSPPGLSEKLLKKPDLNAAVGFIPPQK